MDLVSCEVDLPTAGSHFFVGLPRLTASSSGSATGEWEVESVISGVVLKQQSCRLAELFLFLHYEVWCLQPESSKISIGVVSENPEPLNLNTLHPTSKPPLPKTLNPHMSIYILCISPVSNSFFAFFPAWFSIPGSCPPRNPNSSFDFLFYSSPMYPKPYKTKPQP